MRNKLFFTLVFLCISRLASADIFVIVNAENSINALERKQVVDLFMGRVTAFPTNKPAVTLDLKAGMPARSLFYKTLTGKSEAQVDAYWATLVFAGRMTQPKQYVDEQSLIQTVAEHTSAIAFVSEQPLPDTVKVVLELSTEE